MSEIKRCKWCNTKNPKYVDYHDNEWGVSNFEDKYLFEMLILESYQAGLSWECVLNKRDAFREAYDSFEIDKIIKYADDKIDALAQNKGIIRNKRKIHASIKNARIFKSLVSEFGSFYNYLRLFWDGETIFETGKTKSPLSDEISADLSRRGMTFVGSTIMYSYLQAVGIIYSHEIDCFLYEK